MSTKKLRLGIVMAALVVAVGGPAVGAASATASADTGVAGPSADVTAPVEAPVLESTAVFDWQ